MKKRVIIGLLSITLCFVLVGCSLKKETKKKAKYDYFVLVNKYSKLPDDWEKNIKLVDAKDAWGDKVQIEKEAYNSYKKLKKALKKEGVNIELDSIYRSVKEQQKLWDEWTEEKGIDYVRKYVAVPGYSEHHTGLAVDICLKKNKKIVFENDDMLKEKKIFAKIHSKLADYGFILRYLKDRDSVTGYAYEPWHLRYVGNTKIAKEIMDNNLTLEEYFDRVEDLKSNHEAAKYKIERTLQEYFDDIYEDKIENSRFNVTKIYTEKESKGLKLGKKDIAFDVEYELLPNEDTDPDELTIPNGEYDEELGWVVGIKRVGILKYNSKNGSYSIKDFGTGF